MASARNDSQPATDPPAPELISDAGARATGAPPVADSETISARRRAVVAGHTGDTTTAIELAHHPQAAVRSSALGALAASGALQIQLLIDALGDPAWMVRRRACELAGRLEFDRPASGPVGAEEELVERLGGELADREPLVAEAAAWALGELISKMPDTSCPDTICRACVDSIGNMATEHADALCREAAVAALGAIGDPSSIEHVLAALTDKPPIRRRATVALAAFEDPRADEALKMCLTDRDWQVRQAAEDILGRMG